MLKKLHKFYNLVLEPVSFENVKMLRSNFIRVLLFFDEYKKS